MVHRNDLNFRVTYNVDGCPLEYRRYHSFYKHVRENHRECLDVDMTALGTHSGSIFSAGIMPMNTLVSSDNESLFTAACSLDASDNARDYDSSGSDADCSDNGGGTYSDDENQMDQSQQVCILFN